jgi:hypothetical protein
MQEWVSIHIMYSQTFWLTYYTVRNNDSIATMPASNKWEQNVFYTFYELVGIQRRCNESTSPFRNMVNFFQGRLHYWGCGYYGILSVTIIYN